MAAKTQKRPAQGPREKVLEAFILLCHEEGLLHATLQKAAKKAKVPFATAHYHWGGEPEKLITATLIEVGRKAQLFIEEYLQKSVSEGLNPVESYVRGTFKWCQASSAEAKLWVYFFYHASLNRERSTAYHQFIKVAHQRVLNLLFEAKGRGFYPHASPDLQLAGWVHALVFANGVQTIILQEAELAEALTEATISAIVRLVLPAPASGSPGAASPAAKSSSSDRY
jgi:AcrR family transcriptional regulator